MKSKYEFLIGGILLISLIIYGFLLPDPVYNLPPGNYTCIGDCDGEGPDSGFLFFMAIFLPILVLIAIILKYIPQGCETNISRKDMEV